MATTTFDTGTMLNGLAHFASTILTIDASILMSAMNFTILFQNSSLMIITMFNMAFAAISLSAMTSSLLVFIAREAGPELVGTIGSRTAVVNSDQIVESVSSGVYQAARAALAGQSSGSGTLQLILDGTMVAETVAQNVNGITKRTGRCLVMA